MHLTSGLITKRMSTVRAAWCPPYTDKANNMALFTTGLGDGVCSCCCGHNTGGTLVSIVIDSDVIDEGIE